MQRTIARLTLFAVFTAPVTSLADPPPAPPAPPAATAPEGGQANPPGAPPPMAPPPPPQVAPPPPRAQPMELHEQTPPPGAAISTAPTGRPPLPAPLPDGRWVFTQQYGWVWMPYGQPYTYVIDDAALAYQYAYYPAYGWTWLVAPWILGFGVAPYWGPLGPGHFAWYAHPWFRVGTGHLRPSWGRGPGPGGFGARHFGGGHGRR